MGTVKSHPINGKTLFFTTSPRTPFKTLPEIELLVNELGGKIWNSATQNKFYKLLVENDFFEGKISKDPAFSSRDRINRLPKSLGLITLPVIGLSTVGKELLESENNKEEILLRQLLKFQLPSPYHPLGKNSTRYNVKPYLEVIRLIYDLGELYFDELHIFGIQLVDYKRYDEIVDKIKRFRVIKERYKGKYREFRQRVFLQETSLIYEDEIKSGKIKTRENKDTTLQTFLKTKIRNFRDYSDAVVRHLRTTGIIQVTSIGKTLTITPERRKDVEFILKTIDREPVFKTNLEEYQDYLFNPNFPKLLTDEPELIIQKLIDEFNVTPSPRLTLNQLKDLLNRKVERRKNRRITQQVKELKDYKLYDDIQRTFDDLRNTYEPSLFLEWNTWRSMTMLNGGNIIPNLKFDDEGNPMSTALGNMADIVCDYGDFDVTVEVTMSSGQLQFKMEGEPVPRHIGKHKEQTNKPTYCFFIAPTINPATIAHFYTLYLTNIEMYGGRCCIIPMTLETFRGLLQASISSETKPCPSDIKRLFDKSKELVKECVINDESETVWFDRLTKYIGSWLSN